jgi:hypothetical protein
MARFLIFLGLILVVASLLWPYIDKLGLGRLPGDLTLPAATLRSTCRS